MTRRIRPPKHPITGNPPVDNSLRAAWREYRDYLRDMPPLYAHHAVYQGAPDYETGNPGDWAANAYTPAPAQLGHRLPRKTKKSLVQNTLTAAFQYHPASYYTPERTIL